MFRGAKINKILVKKKTIYYRNDDDDRKEIENKKQKYELNLQIYSYWEFRFK